MVPQYKLLNSSQARGAPTQYLKQDGEGKGTLHAWELPTADDMNPASLCMYIQIFVYMYICMCEYFLYYQDSLLVI